MPSPKQQKSASPKPSSPSSPKPGKLPKDNPAAALFDSPAQNTGPDKKLEGLIDTFIKLRKQRMALQFDIDKLEDQEDQLEDALCTAMISKNLKSIKRTNGVMVIAGQKHEFFIKPETKDIFFKHLKTTGDEGLITTSVNYQTLQGFMNGLLEKAVAGGKAENKKAEGLKKFLEERTRNKVTVRGLGGKL